MTERMKYIWQLLVITAVLILAGILVTTQTAIDLSPWTFLGLLAFTSLVTLGIMIFLWRMSDRDAQNRGLYTLIAIVTKFLLYLIFILIWWAVGKNLSKPFVIAFFALYLIFTIFFVRVMVKTLITN